MNLIFDDAKSSMCSASFSQIQACFCFGKVMNVVSQVINMLLTWYHTLQTTASRKISSLVLFHQCHHLSYLVLTSGISFSLYHCCFITKQPHLFYLSVINCISFINITMYFFLILISSFPCGCKVCSPTWALFAFKIPFKSLIFSADC